MYAAWRNRQALRSTARGLRWDLALRPLGTVIGELTNDRHALDRRKRAMAHLELQSELVLAEELREHLAAEGPHREDLVLLRIVLEQDRRERLRRGPGNHARPGRWIVDAAIRAAGNHLALARNRARLVAIPDEAHLLRRIRHLVRADRGVGDDRFVRADSPVPAIRLPRPGFELDAAG